jgi:peptide methionine sulfoxide reductase MsrB
VFRLAGVFLLFALSGCDWFSRGGPPAQQKFEREEIYARHHETGIYHCTKCGAALFSSEKKLREDSTRWPVFSSAEAGAVRAPTTPLTTEDGAKVVCARCNLHVGHLCRGGELLGAGAPTEGAAICALSSALKFAPK